MLIDNRDDTIPMVSIVTITFNSKMDLMRTSESVFRQSFKNYEFIIIDGESTDGTLKYLDTIKNKVEYILSEKDNGIYFAMNKGLDIAKGQWVQFLNAGDVYYSETTLEDIFKIKIDKEAIIFGKSYTEYKKKRKIRYRDFNLDDDYWYLKKMPNHQAVFIPKTDYKREKFDTNIKIASDTHYLRRIFENNKRVHFANVFVSVFQLGGRSNYYNNFKTFKMILSDTSYAYENRLEITSRKLKHIFKFFLQKILGKEKYLRWYLDRLHE